MKLVKHFVLCFMRFFWSNEASCEETELENCVRTLVHKNLKTNANCIYIWIYKIRVTMIVIRKIV